MREIMTLKVLLRWPISLLSSISERTSKLPTSTSCIVFSSILIGLVIVVEMSTAKVIAKRIEIPARRK